MGLMAAARALASQVCARDVRDGRVFPAASHPRDGALAVSVASAAVAYDQGDATRPRPYDSRAAAIRSMYTPEDV